VSAATVSRILRRLGLNRVSALEPAEPVRRYERNHPSAKPRPPRTRPAKLGSAMNAAAKASLVGAAMICRRPPAIAGLPLLVEGVAHALRSTGVRMSR
jgi:hypothetical protein